MRIYIKDLQAGMTFTFEGMTAVCVSVKCGGGYAVVECDRSRFWTSPLSTCMVAP